MEKYFNVYSLIKGEKKNSYDISFIYCRSGENIGDKLVIVDAAKQTNKKKYLPEKSWAFGLNANQSHPSSFYQESTYTLKSQ